MTGAFELGFIAQPTRGATEVGTFSPESVEAFRLPNDPDTEVFFVFFAHFANGEIPRNTSFKAAGRDE